MTQIATVTVLSTVAALFAFLLAGEQVGLQESAGFASILLGMLAAELAPYLVKNGGTVFGPTTSMNLPLEER